MHTFGIDQQGGKGNAAFTNEVAPTLLHDSHGTPHAVAQTGCFIPGNSARARSLGYERECCITLGTMAGGGTKPAVCITSTPLCTHSIVRDGTRKPGRIGEPEGGSPANPDRR